MLSNALYDYTYNLVKLELTHNIVATGTVHRVPYAICLYSCNGIGQFWNVEVEAERYNVTAEDKIPPNPRHYAVTVSAADGSTRRFFAWKSPRTWDLKSQMCLYSGNAQGGLLYEVTSLSDPVIQGTYDEYIVSSLFDPDYKYEMFTSQCN